MGVGVNECFEFYHLCHFHQLPSADRLQTGGTIFSSLQYPPEATTATGASHQAQLDGQVMEKSFTSSYRTMHKG